MIPFYSLNPSQTAPKILTLQLNRHNGAYKTSFGFSALDTTFLRASTQEFLHPKELEQYHSFSVESRQHTFLHGRFLAKKIVAHYLNEHDIQSFHIKSGIFEQPLVVHSSVDRPAISISHTSAHAACLAFPEEHPMAIDLEMITARAQEDISPQLTDFETRLNDSLQEEENKFYTRVWTIKEALSKVLKTGLMTPMEIYQINSMKPLPYAGFIVSTYTNFGQYKAISFPLKNNICSIVLPKQTHISAILTDSF